MKKLRKTHKQNIFWCDRIFLTISFLIILYAIFSFFKVAVSFAPDFSIFYNVGKDLVNHINPYTDTKLYTVFNYPPLTGMLFMPLSYVPYIPAQIFFIFISFASLFICINVSFKLINKKLSWKTFVYVLALSVLSFPIKFTFGMGQVNLIANALLLLFLYTGLKNKYLLSGICFAFAVILKPILLIFVLMFFYPRYARSLISFIVVIVTMFGLGIVLSQFDYYSEYLQILMPRVSTIIGKGIYYNQSALAFFVRTFGEGAMSYYLTVVTALLLVAYLLYRSYKTRPSSLLAFSYITLVLLLGNSITWQHHLSFLLFPLIYLYFVMRHRIMNVLVFFTCYFLVSSNIKNFAVFNTFPAHFVLSHATYGLVIILIFFLILHERLSSKKEHVY